MTDAEIHEYVRIAQKRYMEMSPAEREDMWRQQRISYVIAEMGMGNDADEAAYRAALEAGDTKEIQRLEEASKGRMAAAENRLKDLGI